MYGKDIYGLSRYGYNPPEHTVNPDEYFVDLARHAPPFLRQVRELAEVWRTQGYEVGLLEHHAADLAKQAFVATATWGLAFWEEMYGVTTNLALPYEQRREIIIAKLRGQGTTTKQMIEDTATAFSGGEVDVIEDSPSHHFIVRFVGVKGIPRNMQAFIGMLEEIKPAHLTYEFQYTYTVWDNLDGFTWSGLSDMAYDDVRVMKGV